jgi:cytoskeletal protein CcmA (bactofilin family)
MAQPLSHQDPTMPGQDFTSRPRTSARLVPAQQLGAINSQIAEDALFEGSLSAQQDLGLRIDGTLHGEVCLAVGGTVHIGPTGVVLDTVIEADHVLIEGQVRGTVLARQTLEITSTASLLGDVVYGTLLDVHAGAKLRGRIEYRPLDTPSAA